MLLLPQPSIWPSRPTAVGRIPCRICVGGTWTAVRVAARPSLALLPKAGTSRRPRCVGWGGYRRDVSIASHRIPCIPLDEIPRPPSCLRGSTEASPVRGPGARQVGVGCWCDDFRPRPRIGGLRHQAVGRIPKDLAAPCMHGDGIGVPRPSAVVVPAPEGSGTPDPVARIQVAPRTGVQVASWDRFQPTRPPRPFPLARATSTIHGAWMTFFQKRCYGWAPCCTLPVIPVQRVG